MTAFRERRTNDGWFRDERGSKSMARALLVSVLLFSEWVIDRDIRGADVSPEVYVFLGGVVMGLIVWAAGSRIGQHLAGAAVAAFSRRAEAPYPLPPAPAPPDDGAVG